MAPHDVSRPILALDLGTTSVKAVAIGASGETVARTERAVATRHPEPGLAEQDADLGLAAAADAVREAFERCPVAPRALALSGAMHGVIPLGAAGEPLGPLRTWADARGATVAARLRADGSWRPLQERNGTPVHASSPLCKIAALRENEPALFAAARAFVSLKELALRRWCGEQVVDLSLATATGMCSLGTGAWDDDALRVAGIDRDRLSRIVPTRHVVTLRHGPIPELPVVVGASDGCLANLGIGAVEDGVVAVTLGTSGAARAIAHTPGAPAESGLFCYALDDGEWIVGGAVNDGGNALVWAADLLFPDTPQAARVETLLTAATAAPHGARGVRFVPRLAGARFPDYDSTPRGGFRGVSLAHGRGDLARAVVEGIVDGVGAVVDALRQRGAGVHEVRAGGGLLRSPLVADLLARRIGTPLAVADAVDASAVGAVILARRALG